MLFWPSVILWILFYGQTQVLDCFLCPVNLSHLLIVALCSHEVWPWGGCQLLSVLGSLQEIGQISIQRMHVWHSSTGETGKIFASAVQHEQTPFSFGKPMEWVSIDPFNERFTGFLILCWVISLPYCSAHVIKAETKATPYMKDNHGLKVWKMKKSRISSLFWNRATCHLQLTNTRLPFMSLLRRIPSSSVLRIKH